jgi:hypothetical protein
MHACELNVWYSLPNIIHATLSRRMVEASHVARICKKRNIEKFWWAELKEETA